MIIANTHIIQLLDSAPWLKTGPANMLACVAETRERLVISQNDMQALANAYGLLGYKDPHTGLAIAQRMIGIDVTGIEGWQYLLNATETLQDHTQAYRAARKLYQLSPCAHHAWQLARATLKDDKPKRAAIISKQALKLMQAQGTIPGSAVLETFAQAGLIEETSAWLHQLALERDDSSGWKALADWQSAIGHAGAALSEHACQTHLRHDPEVAHSLRCIHTIKTPSLHH